MCGNRSDTDMTLENRPEELLARAFRDELGVTIDARALHIFVQSRWSRISTLAHSIHSGPSVSPADEAWMLLHRHKAEDGSIPRHKVLEAERAISSALVTARTTTR